MTEAVRGDTAYLPCRVKHLQEGYMVRPWSNNKYWKLKVWRGFDSGYEFKYPGDLDYYIKLSNYKTL